MTTLDDLAEQARNAMSEYRSAEDASHRAQQDADTASETYRDALSRAKAAEAALLDHVYGRAS